MAVASHGHGFGGQQQPAPIERQPTSAGAVVQPGSQQHLVEPNGRRGGEHLPEWMEQHRGTLEQQQAALDREPGFKELPLQTQMQMHQRLAQLNAMTPEMRARTLAHAEAMERLNPAQRSQVRGAMEQLGSLPMDQRRPGHAQLSRDPHVSARATVGHDELCALRLAELPAADRADEPDHDCANASPGVACANS